MGTKLEINKVNLIQVNVLRVDGGTQSRAALDQATVDEYAQAMLDGAEFPILFAYWDGETFWLAEGFHRVAAAKQAGIEALHVKVYAGGRREALSHSLTANVKHGLRRTNADKHHAVTLMLQDEEWVKWSDKQIAQHCSVDPKTVSNIRKELVLSMEIPQIETRTVTRKGTSYTQNTANVGKPKTGVQPKKPDEHGCLACGEIFDKEVWHCPTCNTHWPPSKDTCPNCYKAPTITTTNLNAAAVADQVFGEGDEPPAEAEAIQKPAHIAPQGDLLEAVNWQAVADQYLAENLALKKEIELYHLENHALVQRNTTIQIELTREKIEFDPNFDPDRDRDYWPEHDTSLVDGKLEAKLLEASENRDYWYRLADELRTKLDKSMQKQQKQAVELLNNQNEIEVLKLTVKGYYEKIEELKSAMAPLYEELGRVRQELEEARAEADQLGHDKVHWFGVAEQLREELDAVKEMSAARIETLGTLADEYCAQAKTEMDEKFRFQMMIVSALAGAPKLVTEDVLKGTTPLRDAMFKLQEMLGLASDSNGDAEQLREELEEAQKVIRQLEDEAAQLAADKSHWFTLAKQLREELNTAMSRKAEIECDLSRTQFELKKIQAEQISGTTDATHAGAHAPARAHSLSSPTIDITHVGDPECVGKEVKGSGEKGKRKRTPKADPRSAHPAIQTVLNQLGQYPPIELYDRIIEILGDNPDKTKLRQCREEWLTRGYSKANFAWLTEWYVIGIPVRQNNSASNGQPVKSRQLLEWEAKMAMVGAPIPQ